jgi:hypothetical protein
MIKIYWPMDDKIPDSVVCDWLDELTKQTPGEMVFELRNDQILYFVRDEDAVAFRLKFGL